MDQHSDDSPGAQDELAAAVLGALRADVLDQVGLLPDAAVISVPALFELPQSAATSEAAKLAGFGKVEHEEGVVAPAIDGAHRTPES